VDVDRAAAYLKEKAIRDRERTGAIEANIRRGLETGKVNNVPFKKALTMVDYKTQKKYEKIAQQVAKQLDASYSEALQVYGESSHEGIQILKRRLILEECMGYVDRALVTRAKLHALKVPDF
jgi:translation initiation factor 2 alpha subunit (eIF-2alpha)